MLDVNSSPAHQVAIKETGLAMDCLGIQAILARRKTQFRCILKHQPDFEAGGAFPAFDQNDIWWDIWRAGSSTVKRIKCPFGRIGDRIWLKEPWQATGHNHDLTPRNMMPDVDSIIYQASASYEHAVLPGQWRSASHMPRWANRILLEITDIQLERLQHITLEGIQSEGIILDPRPSDLTQITERTYTLKQLDKFIQWWETGNGKNSWALNPWVWRITFKHIDAVTLPALNPITS